MSQWVRLWEDMPADPKWRSIARKSGRSISEVIAVFNFMMICAANADRTHTNAHERGELLGWDDDDVASALDIEPGAVMEIRAAMQGKVVDNNTLRAWSKRQPLREDGSAERAKAWRERNRTKPNAPEEKRIESDSEKKDRESRVRATPKHFKIQISEKAEPTPQQELDADNRGLKTLDAIKAEWTKFRDYYLAKGIALADWNAAWRRWLDKTESFKPNGQTDDDGKRQPPPKLPGQDRYRSSTGLYVDGEFYPD